MTKTEARQLKSAPITEAIISYKVSRTDSDKGILKSIAEEIKGEFPEYEWIYGFDSAINGQSSGSVRGVRCKNEKDNIVVQIKFDGLTINKLEPYHSWESLYEKALPIWKIYCEKMDFEELLRINVRYINKFYIPIEDDVELSVYIKNPPQYIEGLPVHISSYLTRLTIHDEKKAISANMVQAFKPSEQEDQGCVMLIDNDCWKDIGKKNVDDKELLEGFSTLRELKNNIFFGTLTEKTMELFK